MDAADLHCLPSLQDGLPPGQLEALAAGLPTVATRVRADRAHALAVARAHAARACARGYAELYPEPYREVIAA